MTESTIKNANILIVDDAIANIDVLAGLLEMQEYTNVKFTTDPRQVVDLFRSFSPDLILLDLMMPHLSGFEVMAQLKVLIPEGSFLPILVLTANITAEAKQRALEGGAKDFLVKPFDLVEVGLRIKNLLFARFLYLQLQNQNRVLDEKVKERTFELETANVELVAARDKAEAGDRLKTEFIQNISHEIRTPLNGILGMFQVLTDPANTWQEKQEYYALLKSSSDRLIKTVTDYLDISLLFSGNMLPKEGVFSPRLLLEDINNSFRQASEARQLSLSVQLPPPESGLLIKSDQALLYKVLSQLVDNAVKFTRQGSVSMGYEKSGGELEFFVRDTGEGIAEASFARIFDSFMMEDNSATRSHEGSGLGLTIAKNITEMLGGRIRFESVKGKGSVFYVSIPVGRMS